MWCRSTSHGMGAVSLLPACIDSLDLSLEIGTSLEVLRPLLGHHNNSAPKSCRWRTHRSPEYFVNFRRFELPVSLESAKRRCYKALSKYSQTRPHMDNLQELCIDVYQRHHARKLAAWFAASSCMRLPLAAYHPLLALLHQHRLSSCNAAARLVICSAALR